MKINFIGHRHVIDRLMSNGQLNRGSAICFISSVAGIGWETDLPRLQEFLATPDFESADAWVKAHEADNFGHYGTSKQAINAYVATHAFPFLAKGIRINAICPGPTDTPLARANADLWLSFAQDYREATGAAVHTPEQMGNVMAFLNSDAAAGINGVTLLVDYGHVNSSNTGTFPAGKPIIDLLMGRISLG
jgi:NAD(P)-dependent dehydrogenase (short-subunit alcohol dehydrogenase family)